MANEAKMVFDTATTCISLTATLADGNVAGGTTVLDNSIRLYPLAVATFNNPDTFLAAPDNRSTIDLYMVRQDTDGTSDDTSAPTGTDVEGAEYVGSFVIYDTDEEQRHSITISLAGVQKAFFYIMNNSGTTLSYTSSPITVKITPFTYGPA